jgi:hypothetical protein
MHPGDPGMTAAAFSFDASEFARTRVLVTGGAPGMGEAIVRRLAPPASAQKDDKAIVTNRLTGNVPGSPIDLQFIFGLDGTKLASLEIPS